MMHMHIQYCSNERLVCIVKLFSDHVWSSQTAVVETFRILQCTVTSYCVAGPATVNTPATTLYTPCPEKTATVKKCCKMHSI